MTTTLPTPGAIATAITTPGVYDMTADAYHADPVPGGSLSSSGARRLLPPSCPALYAYDRQHGRAAKREFDLGHAAHQLVLGAGPELWVVDAEDWRTKAAREERDRAYADGQVPLLAYEYERVADMAHALRQHPIASVLFDPELGEPERSLFWVDQPTGVWCRARLDWLRGDRTSSRLIVPDYKTCASASPEKLTRAIHDHGYHVQGAFHLAGARALGLAGDDARFLFVCQEKTAPYLVTVVELSQVALQIGHWLSRRAIDTYAQCTATGRWPGYSDDVEYLGLPAHVERTHLEEM